MIYLDNSATTRPNLQVLESFTKASSQFFGNPSSIHGIGMDAERLLRKSREQAASILKVQPNEIIFTAGGTEGNNIAIKGTALAHQKRGKHIITTAIEHPSVLEACQGLESLGFEVTYLPVNAEGFVEAEYVKKAMRKDTILVSIMHVNNEIGTIQPIEEIGAIVKNYPKALFHVDHVQGFGKVPLNIEKSHIDLCTISAHKIHGLKGTGLLVVRNGVRLFSLAHGGGQEQSIRSGTENVAGIVSFVKAMRLANEKQSETASNLTELKKYLIEQLQSSAKVKLNTPANNSAPHIVNFSVPGFKPEVMIHALEESDIYISTKSACSSKSADESAVLIACGKNRSIATSGLRVSMSYETTKEEIVFFSQQLENVIQKLSEVMG
ncbi:cysteine desulfurase [Gracilibacillus caseinilyticus]|uniref:Cysteine desulfurase n=1 Tax=Gracilibacillus caseinilyticus TaxID=2932256 RepID=A0ABY4ERS3_9BACI|nr:cysteine desulfurase family protein [Gracilibacillus caseinilyticus]UOQ47138.1 cysteine desulfurase [Gracilibacillus caseinilyticus]